MLRKRKHSLIFILLVGLGLLFAIAGCKPLLGTFEVGYLDTSEITPEINGNGIAEGSVCFFGIQNLDIQLIFYDLNTENFFQYPHNTPDMDFSISLPAGQYNAFAAASIPGLIGGFSQAVQCGLGPDCNDHQPIPFEIQPGQTTSNIFICDWLLPSEITEKLPLVNLGIQPEESPISTSTPDATPRFSPTIYFAPQPDLSHTQRVFPAGSPQIFAIWEYSNMRPDLIIRREWYQDDELWITREEKWDFKKYGTYGFVTDVSIFDFDVGLPAGNYWLRLFIDNQEQTIPNELDRATFIIETIPTLSPILSYDRNYTASITPPGRLNLEDSDGVIRTLVVENEISSYAWHPNNQVILYSSRNRSGQFLARGTQGILDTLWAINIFTEEKIPLSDENDNFHSPLPSPNGKYIAVVSGSGWSDACYVDSKLWVLEINDLFQVVYSTYYLDFTGLPDPGNAYVEEILGWESNNELSVSLRWVCSATNNTGVYSLDLTTKTAYMRGVVSSWKTYNNDLFGITFQFPSNWKQTSGDPESGERYDGPDGFFSITGMGGASLDELAIIESQHRLLPFGTRPTIDEIQVQGLPARLISPSLEQFPDIGAMAALLIELPEPVSIGQFEYPVVAIYSDPIHIQNIIQTLIFQEN